MASDEFPCLLTLSIPFPTLRLASVALRALQVDKELSPLVRRTFSLPSPPESETTDQKEEGNAENGGNNTLRVEYAATTNRMLRVAVNAFMDSLVLIVEVMEKLDVDVLDLQGRESEGGE